MISRLRSPILSKTLIVQSIVGGKAPIMSAFISLSGCASFISMGSASARGPRSASSSRSLAWKPAEASPKTTVLSQDTALTKPLRGIMKPKPVSQALQAFLGVKEIPRTQALKQIWAYIKENELQDPENKKIIVCDAKLKSIFGGRDRVGFLEISGLLNPHFVK